MSRNKNINTGFTIVEILVAMAISITLAAILLRNFTTSINLDRVANVVVSDLRSAQAYAASSKKYQGPNDASPVSRCGWGFNQGSRTDNHSYIIYAGPPTATGNCGSRQWQSSQDVPTFKTVILDPRLEFQTNPAVKDIYYEPPGPQTWIGNTQNYSPQQNPQEIRIRKVGVTKQQCDSGNVDCIKICAYLSGRIEVTKAAACP